MRCGRLVSEGWSYEVLLHAPLPVSRLASLVCGFFGAECRGPVITRVRGFYLRVGPARSLPGYSFAAVRVDGDRVLFQETAASLVRFLSGEGVDPATRYNAEQRLLCTTGEKRPLAALARGLGKPCRPSLQGVYCPVDVQEPWARGVVVDAFLVPVPRGYRIVSRAFYASSLEYAEEAARRGSRWLLARLRRL